MAAKTTAVLYFCYILLHDFCMIWGWKTDVSCFSIKMTFVRPLSSKWLPPTYTKNYFYARELWYQKQHLFIGKLKNRQRNTADKVASHSKLYLITVYYNILWFA